MRKRVVYLAAPVSPTAAEIGAESERLYPDVSGEARIVATTEIAIKSNLARARRWLRWLVENTDWSIVCSWMPYVETLDEAKWRARGLEDDKAALERCDAIVMVGGRVSSGMAIERDHAASHGLRVVDLTEFGEEPPTDEAAACRLLLAIETLGAK